MRKVSTRGVNREAIGRLEELRRDRSRGTVGIALFSILSLSSLALGVYVAGSEVPVELSVLLCILIGILCAGFLILTLRAIEGLRESKDSWNTYGRLQIKRVYGFDTDRTPETELKRVQYRKTDSAPRAPELDHFND